MPRAPSSVLVLDANGQAGLSVIRSLGRQGVTVTAGSDVRFSLGRLSHQSASAYLYPDPNASSERFVRHLVDYLETAHHSIVIPIRDSTSAVLSKHKADIEETGTTVAVEDWKTFDQAYDKGRLFSLAESLNVAAPESFDPSSVAAVSEIAPDIPYPAIVKPRSKTAWDESGKCYYTRVDDTHYVESPVELVATYESLLEEYPVLEEQAHYPLIQESIDGTTTTTVVLAKEGDILTHFQEKRIRTYPSSGGSSTLLLGLRDPRMLASAREVISALDCTGPAMVEFMRTPDGEPYLIEVNGRYWGSLPFAIRSGVDIPWQYYRLLNGLDVEPPDYSQTASLHHRLLYGDIKWLNEQLQQGNPTAVLHFLLACLRAEQTFASIEDPKPTLWALCQEITLGIRTGLQRVLNTNPDGLPLPSKRGTCYETSK